ncbi:MAG: response regulator [Nitrospiraceae bacterium]|nr:response regulator [Nitrospiraceae bacterium]
MKRILIVEDEVITAMNLADLLETWGFEPVGPVTSGEEAVGEVREERPDLVLMDVKIKGEMGGIEAARRIVQEFGIPVILMSGYSKSLISEQISDHTNIKYISKPLDLGKLRRMIEGG